MDEIKVGTVVNHASRGTGRVTEFKLKSRDLRWFWLNTAGNSKLKDWLSDPELLKDVDAVERHLEAWVESRGDKKGQLPFNHYRLFEKPKPDVQFLEYLLNDEPCFM
jgi:hypothetical protein